MRIGDLTLPNDADLPANTPQRHDVPRITPSVHRELPAPIGFTTFRDAPCLPATAMTVPETTMNEKRKTDAPEDDVRTAWKIAGVKTVSNSRSPESPTD
jgi:hypothetical protein